MENEDAAGRRPLGNFITNYWCSLDPQMRPGQIRAAWHLRTLPLSLITLRRSIRNANNLAIPARRLSVLKQSVHF